MKTIVKFLLFITLCINFFSLFAQDIIVLKSGEEFKAIVQEVELSTIKYKKFENTNGPTYTLLKSDIFMIKYQNGEKDVFSTITEKTQKEEDIPNQQNDIREPILLRSDKNNIYVGSTKLSSNDVRNTLSINSEALRKYNSGKRLKTWSNILAWSSGACIGWGLGTLLSSNNSENNTDIAYTLIGVGAVGITIGFILEHSGNQNIKTAVILYNSSVSNKNTHESTELKFGLTQHGIGLTFNF